MRGRNRWMLPLGVLTAAVMLVGWFPASALWHQQAQINATAAQIKALQREELSLTNQAKTVDTKAAATQLARAQYQLVSPGQSLIQVLPGNAAGQVSPSSADPGLQPLVSPANAGLSTGSPASTVTRHTSANAYLSRLVRTLEFWR
ncbi:MAG TPA: septum formation initiator family protein [Acidimicrobiales bacterium]|nr:septum formation initiator family protein [Acidimicrobiales bacterium]